MNEHLDKWIVKGRAGRNGRDWEGIADGSWGECESAIVYIWDMF